jgi:hypothetical protein
MTISTTRREIVRSASESEAFEDTVDLGALLVAMLRGWWVILIVVLLALFAAYYSVTRFTPQYTARMLVVPSGGTSSPIRGLPSQQGIVQSIFGSISQEASTFSRFQATLGSVALASRMDERHGYLHRIFSGLWDETNKVWVRPTDWRSDLQAFAARLVGAEEWVAPSIHDLASFAGSQIRVSEMLANDGVYEITVTYPDRALALDFLRDAFEEAEELIKREDRLNTATNIDYIRGQLRDVNIAEYKSSFIQVLAQEEKKMMALSADLPYAARVVDPPNVSDRATVPNLLLFVFAAIVGGVLLGVTIIIAAHLVRLAVRREKVPA